jgi:hypothetical protein
LPTENNNTLGLQCSLRHWKQILNLFIAPLPTTVCLKGRRESCVRRWQFGNELPTAARDGAVTLKGSHRMEYRRTVLKISARHSLITTYCMSMKFGRIHLARQYLERNIPRLHRLLGITTLSLFVSIHCIPYTLPYILVFLLPLSTSLSPRHTPRRAHIMIRSYPSALKLMM